MTTPEHPFAWMDSRMWNPDDPDDMAELARAERERQEYDDAEDRNGGSASGMTLRDWFAGQFMAQLLVSDYEADRYGPVLVERAYYLADAMLAERSK